MVIVAAAAPVLTVLAAPTGLLAGVRDALQDWSAVGLVQPFCWAEDPPRDGARRVEVLQVEDGRSRGTTVEQLLALHDFHRIRLCVLVPAFAAADVLSTDAEDHLLRLVRASRGGAEVDYLRVTVTRPGSGPGAGRVAREGWHNLVLSPEEARGPGSGHQRLEATADPLEVGSVAGASLCGILGLWSGVAEGPMDSRRVSAGEHALVARSFFRSLHADEVEQALRAGVMSMSGFLPRPTVGNGRAVVVEDVQWATSAMAEQLWTKHREVLRGRRTERTPVVATRITAGRAIAMLSGFLVAAVKNAPVAWYQAVVDRVASTVAAQVQQTVLGQAPSAYEVVVRGVRADGTPASWDDLVAASGELREVVGDSAAPTRPAAHAGLATLWRDYVGAALTLADAGDRSPQLPPVTVGVDRAVVPRAADCAPGPDADFAVPAALVGVVRCERVEAADHLRQRSLREALVRAGNDPVLGSEAERTVAALDQWGAQHQQSFTVQSGRRLAGAVLGLHTEVRTLLAALATAVREQTTDDELRRKQERLAFWTRVLALVAVLVLLVFAQLGRTAVLPWPKVAEYAGATVLVWFVGSLVLFLKSQRNLFAELNRRKAAASEAKINQENLAQALEDLRRTTSAYGQHLAWSRVLGAVLAQPLGAGEGPPADPVLSHEGLPLGMAVAAAAPEPGLLSEVCAQVRRDSFRSGWLTTPWEQILCESAARLGPDGIDLRDDPDQLYGLRAGNASLLDHWADLLRTEGPGRSSGEAFWTEEAVAAGHLPDALVDRVSAGPGAPVTNRRAFLSGVGTAGEAGTTIFDGYVFTASARTAQADTVAERWSRTVRRGLSFVAVTVELSDGLPTYELEGLETQHDVVHSPPAEPGIEF